MAPKPTKPSNPDAVVGRHSGPGGLDLSALAAQGAAETGTRIAGQKSILDAYLSQVLGEAAAGNAAQSERQGRMHDFRRSQQLVEEQLGQKRLGQETALQRARIAASAKDSQAQRDWAAGQSAEERAFELGQAAVQRAGQARAEAEDKRRWEAEYGLKAAALGAEGGDDPTNMSPRQASQTFGDMYVGADRGQYLNTRPAADRIRGRSYTQETPGSGFRIPGTEMRPLGGERGSTQNVTFDDLLAKAAEFQQGNANPADLRQKLLELFGSETAASLALFELGDLAAFPEAE